MNARTALTNPADAHRECHRGVRLRRIAERLSRSGFWDYDRTTGATTWSKGLYRVFGLTPDGSCPRLRSFLDRARPEDRTAVRAALHRGVKDGLPFAWEGKIVRPDGSVRYLRCRGSVIRKSDGRTGHLLGCCQDVTREKKLERQARRAGHAQAAVRVAAAVAHDLNNLLTVVGGLSELMLTGIVEQAPTLREIRRAADRGGALTRKMLRFCRGAPGGPCGPVATDVGDLVRQAEDLLRALLGKSVKLTVAVGSGPLTANVDPLELEQALLNLAANARDAMPDGGEFRVGVFDSADGEGKQRVVVVCSDAGCGMDDDTKRHIFERYYTTKGPEKGSGLGLTQVHEAVRRSGGSVSVSSAPGKGTTFEIYLPQ
jgi:PAS domain S-box-containing protein